MISPSAAACLRSMYALTITHDADVCFNFRTIQAHLPPPMREHMTVAEVRRQVRVLFRRKLTIFERGLWAEDGRPAGAGYRLSPSGRELAAKISGGN